MRHERLMETLFIILMAGMIVVMCGGMLEIVIWGKPIPLIELYHMYVGR